MLGVKNTGPRYYTGIAALSGSRVKTRGYAVGLLIKGFGIMNSVLCPICSNGGVISVWWNRKLNKCKNCGLLFNEIDFEYDYENATRFTGDKKLIAKYEKYSRRDFELIRTELGNVKKVLEIGSGYGLLSVNIKKYMPDIRYFHLEKNLSLRDIYVSRGDSVLSELDGAIKPDLIIMAHCLEHIKSAPQFIGDALNLYKDADVILFQTNPNGFIPRWLPWLWYGWSFDQHYYHFSTNSLVELMGKYNRSPKNIKYYKLHQEASLSVKGVVKACLSIVNLFVRKNNMDAYMIRFSKQACGMDVK